MHARRGFRAAPALVFARLARSLAGAAVAVAARARPAAPRAGAVPAVQRLHVAVVRRVKAGPARYNRRGLRRGARPVSRLRLRLRLRLQLRWRQGGCGAC